MSRNQEMIDTLKARLDLHKSSHLILLENGEPDLWGWGETPPEGALGWATGIEAAHWGLPGSRLVPFRSQDCAWVLP